MTTRNDIPTMNWPLWLEGSDTHGDDRPFCDNPDCGCHCDPLMIAVYITRPLAAGELTQDEGERLRLGQSITGGRLADDENENKEGQEMNMQENELAPNGRTKVQVELVGQDGNAFAVIGRVQKAMRRAGWPTDEITAFRVAATSGDYQHLLATCMAYVDDIGGEDEEEDEDS